MLLKTCKFLFLSAGVSLIPVHMAHAQLLTGFGESVAPKAQEPQSQIAQEEVLGDTAWSAPLTQLQPIAMASSEASATSMASPKNNPVESSQGGLLTGFGEIFEPAQRIPEMSAAQPVAPSPSELSRFPLTSPFPSAQPDLSNPVDLQADYLTNDENTNTVTAFGNVMMMQDDRILRADEISYNTASDRVIARGHVVLNEPSGDIHTADEVELTDSMKSGFVERLESILADGSRFTAARGRRENAQRIIMSDASYTACDPCKSDPDKPLTWRLRASEVTHHEEEQRISYRNARLEMWGVPVLYTPYFSHPDGSVEQKSGFLTPEFGIDSQLGVNAGTRYYWGIAPDKDATIGLRAFSKQLPLVTAEWRQRWDNASLRAQGGVTYSERRDKVGGQNLTVDEELRGHVFADGLVDINDKWRGGLKLEYASDDQYMRQYDFSKKDVLSNELYAERFSGRNYSAVRFLAFQDVRVGQLRNNNQPQILPEVTSSWVGEPDSVPIIGGRWQIDGSMLGLHREGSGADMGRASLETSWHRRLVSDYGLLTTLDGSLRGDVYTLTNQPATQPRGDSYTTSRLFPQFHTQSSYPIARNFERFQYVIEPVASLTLAPRLNKNSIVPNEDSQDVQIDSANLFNPNRFPGYDRIEDKSRVTYGMRNSLFGHDGSAFEAFLGQSYRLDNDNNPFPVGSGLENQKSDYVGDIYMNYRGKYGLNYRFQYGSETLKSRRHEIDATATIGKLSLSSTYLYTAAVQGTGINNSREQLGANAGYFLTDNWRINGGAVQDLGVNSGLRYAYGGLDYFGQCLTWSTRLERNLTDDASGNSNTALTFRIGLRNLGEFQSSAIEIATTEARDSISSSSSIAP